MRERGKSERNKRKIYKYRRRNNNKPASLKRRKDVTTNFSIHLPIVREKLENGKWGRDL